MWYLRYNKKLFWIIWKISICFIRFIVLLLSAISIGVISLLLLLRDSVYFFEWEFINLQTSSVLITFLLDWMRTIFLSFVLFISCIVVFYRKEYIIGDLRINRFILLILLFVFSIIILIIRPNLIRILLGWDGLGLVSYCLVIYFQNEKSYNAGILTALSNRIGDVALLIAIAWILNYGGWRYIFYVEFIKKDKVIEIVGSLIILAAMTKRAQIPFSSWLPAAIAAPTPVSALVHSSTLVTAGIYLLIRFNALFIDTYFIKFILLVGGLTIFMAGVSANFEFDLKKIIALSTLSQLGLIIRILGIGFFQLAFFHLLIHALFKALLFLCAGSIIHNIDNSQDIREIGGLINFMPFTISCFNIANLALCGIPFLAGFYSKDLILEVSIIYPLRYLSYVFYFFSTGLTVSYSFRLVFYTISGEFNEKSFNNLRDGDSFIAKSIVGLLIIAVIRGAIFSWIIFSSSLIICLSLFIKLTTLIVCVMGGLRGYLLKRLEKKVFYFNKSLGFYFPVFINRVIWFIPYISTSGLVPFFLNLGGVSHKVFDQGWSEYLGASRTYISLKWFSLINQFFQNNNLKIYLIVFIFWLIFLAILIA